MIAIVLQQPCLSAQVGAGFEPRFWWLIVAWLAVMGALIGSFMNVVVYRMPRGMPLALPGSACPYCAHPVRWFDNVPVVSWLVLGARCRDCGRRISARYPLVEALVVGIFVWLALAEVYRGGATLPEPIGVFSLDQISGENAQWQNWLWVIYLVQLLMLCTLLCAALIEYDGRCPPLALYVPAFVVGLVVLTLVGPARPVPAWVASPLSDTLAAGSGRSAAWVDATVGCSIGFVAGLLVALGGRTMDAALSAPWNLAVVGSFLGWQAAVFAAAAMAAVGLVADLAGRGVAPLRRIPDSMWLVALVFALLLNWGKLLAAAPWLLSPHAKPAAVAGVLALTAGVGVVRMRVRRRQP